MTGVDDRLAAWFAAQLPDAGHVAVEGLDRVEIGHSAEILLLTTGQTLAVDGGHCLRRGRDFTTFLQQMFDADALDPRQRASSDEPT